MNVEQASDIDKITLSKVDSDKINDLNKEPCYHCKKLYFINQDIAILSCKVTYHINCLEKVLSKVS